MEVSERLYRACVMLCEAECRECSASSGLAEALMPTCLHNANRANFYFDEGLWRKGGLHLRAQLCSQCETTNPSVAKAKAEMHTILCMQYGLCTYRAISVHWTLNCVSVNVVTGVVMWCISSCVTYEAQASTGELCNKAFQSEQRAYDRSSKMIVACRAEIGLNNAVSTASAAGTQDCYNIDHLKATLCLPKEETGCMLFTRSTVCNVAK